MSTKIKANYFSFIFIKINFFIRFIENMSVKQFRYTSHQMFVYVGIEEKLCRNDLALYFLVVFLLFYFFFFFFHLLIKLKVDEKERKKNCFLCKQTRNYLLSFYFLHNRFFLLSKLKYATQNNYMKE